MSEKDIRCDYCEARIDRVVHNVGSSWNVILACSKCAESRTSHALSDGDR